MTLAVNKEDEAAFRRFLPNIGLQQTSVNEFAFMLHKLAAEHRQLAPEQHLCHHKKIKSCQRHNRLSKSTLRTHSLKGGFADELTAIKTVIDLLFEDPILVLEELLHFEKSEVTNVLCKETDIG